MTPDAHGPLQAEAMTPGALKQRRSRNLAIAGALCAFALLVFAITIVRMSQLP